MKYEFEQVCPIYSGGGIYCFVGRSDKGWFIGSDDFFDVYFVDVNPFSGDEIIEDVFDGDWQEEHIIEFYDEDNLNFFGQMLDWIINNQDKVNKTYDHNYQMDDMEIIKSRLEDYRKELGL